MIRNDRDWTAAIAVCGLDQAQSLLRMLAPDPFAKLDFAKALSETGLILDRQTPFMAVLKPALTSKLGAQADQVFAWLDAMPFVEADYPATAFWRGMFRELRGQQAPALDSRSARCWYNFVQAFRGRDVPPDSPAWLHSIAADAIFLRQLRNIAKEEQEIPLTEHDRHIQARFGWNDAGELPGLTDLLDAAFLLGTRRAWNAAAPNFSPQDQEIIEAAAAQVMAIERVSAMESLDEDAKRIGVSTPQLEADLFPTIVAPPLSKILNEAS